jgi:hypothetical protein
MISEKVKKNAPYFVLLLFAIPLFFLRITNAHGLGDDFSQYVKEADNISKGIPYYASNWVFNELDWGYSPPQYPPGYPLLLAPVVSVFGIAIKPMLYMNSLIAAALLFALFAYFRKHAGDIIAVCLALIIIYSHEILDAKGQLLSDVPCMLFVVLYLLVRNYGVFSTLRTLLLIGLATMVALIRSQGLVLLAAEAAFLGITLFNLARSHRLSWPNVKGLVSLRVVPGALLLLFILNKLVFSAPTNTLDYYVSMMTHRETGIWQMMKTNAEYLLSLFRALLHFPLGPFGWRITSALECAFSVLAAIGLLISVSKKVTVDGLFFILMCLVIIIMPIHQGARFLFEAFPMFVLFAYVGIKALAGLVRLTPAVIIVPATLLYLFVGMKTYKLYSRNECEGCVPSPGINLVFNYLLENMSDSDVIICPRPRLITLFTNKKAIVFASNASFAKNKQKFDQLKVKYIFPWFDDNLRDYMRETHQPIDSQILGELTIYRVR